MVTPAPRASVRSGLPTELSDADLAAFQRLALKLTGIKLEDAKRSMIYTRFLRRLRALDLPDFGSYLKYVAMPGSDEFEQFVNTITTNLTYFFREPHHFEFLASSVVPDLFSRRASAEPVRIWSAGCSSGEEPYSIAMTLAEAGQVGGRNYKLLCTDIDTSMVRKTAQGRYPTGDVRGLSTEQIARWFDARGQFLEAKPALRNGMMCRDLNMFADWPFRPGVDIVFCRNVLIYFERDLQEQVIRKFADVQEPGSYLFLGHSESMRGLDNLYKRVDNTVYQRQG